MDTSSNETLKGFEEDTLNTTSTNPKYSRNRNVALTEPNRTRNKPATIKIKRHFLKYKLAQDDCNLGYPNISFSSPPHK